MRWVLVPALAVVLPAGVWITGGVLAGDYRTSMALTAGWLLAAGAACAVVARRRRPLRVPLLGTYVLITGAIGAFLALATLRDRVVAEVVVVGVPAAEAAGHGAPARDVQLASGRFRPGEHDARGRAAVVRVPGGRRFLTLRGFATSPGPDLRVRVAPGDTFDGGRDGVVDLGALKGNRGDQQYRLPAGLPVAGRSVVIWCRAFSAPFASARLEAS